MDEINISKNTVINSASIDNDGNILVTVNNGGTVTTNKIDTTTYIGTLTTSPSVGNYYSKIVDDNYDTSISLADWVAKPGDYVKPINKEGEEKTKEVFLTVDPKITKKDTIGWKLAYWQEEFLNGNKGNVAVRVAFKAEDDAWLAPFGIFVEGSKWTGISIYVSPECDSSYLDDEQLLVNAILDILEANFKDEAKSSRTKWDEISPDLTWTTSPASSATITGVYNPSWTTVCDATYNSNNLHYTTDSISTASSYSSYSITCNSANNTYNIHAKG